MIDIERNFTYHAPTEAQIKLYGKIRKTAGEFATMIQEECPDSRERSLALTKLEETVMWANASVAREQGVK